MSAPLLPRGAWWSTALIATLLGAAVTLLAWARLPPVARDTLWAEDGRLFLHQRVDLGVLATLVRPYDGYQHLLPRLLTDVATLLPAEDYARTITGLSCLTVGAVAAAVFAFSVGTVRTTTARAVLAAVPVLTPAVAIEVLGNLANLHSFAMVLVPVVLLFRPRRRATAAVAAAVVFLAAATEIQSLLFLPLLVLMGRRRSAWPVGAAYLLGLLGQVVSMLLTPRVRSPQAQSFADVVRGWFLEPVLSTFWPDATAAATRVEEHGFAVAVLAAAPFALALVVALVGRWRRNDGSLERRAFVIAVAVASPVLWVVDLVLNPTPLIAFAEHGAGYIGQVGYLRYAVVPSMFLLAVVVTAGDRLLSVRAGGPARRMGQVALRATGGLVLVLVLVLGAWRFVPQDVTRAHGPEWQQSFDQAERTCAAGAEEATVDGAPTGWDATIDCDDIDDDVFH